MKKIIALLTRLLFLLLLSGTALADIPPGNTEMQKEYIYKTLRKHVNYPQDARKNAVNGHVKLTFHIDRFGAVQVQKVDGNPKLSQYVVNMLSRVKFHEPAVFGKEYKIKISFVFHN